MAGRDREEKPEADPAAPAEDLEAAGVRTPFWRVPTYRFALLYGLFLIGIALIYPRLVTDFAPTVRQLEAATAKVVYQVLALFSSEAALRSGRGVSFGGFSVTIIDECLGIYEALFYTAAVLAYPTSWRKTLYGIGLGVPVLYAVNVLRIIVLLIAGRYYHDWFTFMHLYFWQVTMVVMVAGTWLLWLLWVVREGEPSE
jgi:exosortase H (IPTLxxWG-CTERM-specific)